MDERSRRMRPGVLAGVIAASALVTAACQFPGSSPRTAAGPARPEHTLTAARAEPLGPLAFSPDGKTLAAAGIKAISLFDPLAGRRKAAWIAPRGDALTSLAFSPDGATLAVSVDGPGSNCYLWNVAARKVQAALPSPRNVTIGDVAFSPDGTTVAGSSDDSGITYLWDAATRRVAAALSAPSSWAAGISPAVFSPDGGTLAIGNGAVDLGRHSGEIAVWNVGRQRIPVIFREPARARVASVAFSPDGRSLAATGLDHVYVWGVAARRLAATFTGPRGAVALAVAFSPDSRVIAAIFSDNSAYLWNVRTGRLAAELPDPGGSEIASLAYSPDGKILAVGDYQGHIFLWNAARTDPPPGR